MRRMGGRWRWVVLFGLLSGGCYQWVQVPPAELPKLDRREPAATATVATADGKTVDVDGDFAVRVTTRHDSFDFTSPISCTVTPERLQIAEVGAAPVLVSHGDIERAEVYRYRKTLSRTLMVGGAVVAVLLGYLAFHQMTDHSGGVK
jgi:hypothetical protein